MFKKLFNIFLCKTEATHRKDLYKDILSLITAPTPHTSKSFHRYIVPSPWLKQLVAASTSATAIKPALPVACFSNGAFLLLAKPKRPYLRRDVDVNGIAFITYELMQCIHSVVKFDYVIQVEYDSETHKVNLNAGVNVFERNCFGNFTPREDYASVRRCYFYGNEVAIEGNVYDNNRNNSSTSAHTMLTPINEYDTVCDAMRQREEMLMLPAKFVKASSARSSSVHSNMNSNSNSNGDYEVTSSTTDNTRSSSNTNSNSNNNGKRSLTVIPFALISNLNSFKGTSLPPIGLANPSVYCFMNTCLQCLISIPELNYYFISNDYLNDARNAKRSALRNCNAYRQLLTSYQSHSSYFFPPKSIYTTCHSFLPSHHQHDCQEFLRRLLGSIQDELNITHKYTFPDNITMTQAWSMYRSVNASFVDALFSGLMRSSVTCCKCKHTSYTFDPFMDVAVSIESCSHDALESCLRKYFDREVIDCGYKCERCGKRTQIVKKLDVVLPPPILTIQFKRFGSAGRRKINTNIQFGRTVDIQEFVAEEVMLKQTKYELFAVAVHLGHSIELGHYVAFVKRNGMWFECNDESVYEVRERTALSRNAYLVFYRRKDGDGGDDDDEEQTEEEEVEEDDEEEEEIAEDDDEEEDN